MRPVRAAFAAAAVLASVTTFAAPPAGAKAKRLTPADPPPAAVAVPEEPPVSVLGSCKLPDGSCADYQGTFTGVDAQGLCAKAKGTWSASACPTEGGVGTCTQRQVGSDDRIVTRSYGPVKADAARKACVKLPRGIFLKSP